MQVSFFNHGNEIIQLGDVRNIDEKKIKEIAPIDLLIGGSPCNELSMANPKRRGLDGIVIIFRYIIKSEGNYLHFTFKIPRVQEYYSMTTFEL